jgi:hypothetical protein
VHSDRSIERHLQMPPEIQKMLRRACMDCHSNETQWPWYSRIAPVSWTIARDVQRGRRVMNFSEWSVQAGRRPEIAASMLAASCTAAKSGRMPRFPYRIFHPEARISKSDVEDLCGWTGLEIRRLVELKKQRTTLHPVLLTAARGEGSDPGL